MILVVLIFSFKQALSLSSFTLIKKIFGRNINNLRYAGDTTQMTESEEELNNFLMRVKEESERASLRLNIKKN